MMTRQMKLGTLGKLVVVALLGITFGMGGCEVEEDPPPISGPSYHADVAPLLAAHCASCHQPGAVGGFSLSSYQDAVDYAPLIAATVTTRTMPPNNIDNSGDCQKFVGVRWLQDTDIATIQDWVDAGTPEGPAVEQALTPEPDTLSESTIFVDMPAAYTPKPSDSHPNDDYRCFFLEVDQEVDTHLTAFEISPGTPGQVHHMLLFALNDDASETAADALDAADPELGWRCFGDSGVQEAEMISAWAPGNNIQRFPQGTGLLIPAKHRLVMQIHYNIAAGARPDRTGLHLALTAEQVKDAAMVPIADPSWSLDTGEPRVEYTSTTSLRGLPEPLEVHGVFPHMHTLGRELRLAVQPVGDESEQQCLANVPNWDFDWQQAAFYEQIVLLDGSQELSLTCVWNTVERAGDAPIHWGEGTADEMCLVFLYVTRENGRSVAELLGG